MTDLNAPPPILHPRLLTEEKDMLVRAVDKWIKFQTAMWNHINANLERKINRQAVSATLLRTTIIILSAAITTMSDISWIERSVITFVAGTLTALTGLEAYFKLADRHSDARKQQREIEALRDQLRFKWFIQVEIESDTAKRISAAKRLLEDGPKAYNEILNRYELKGSTVEKPQANG